MCEAENLNNQVEKEEVPQSFIPEGTKGLEEMPMKVLVIDQISWPLEGP